MNETATTKVIPLGRLLGVAALAGMVCAGLGAVAVGVVFGRGQAGWSALWAPATVAAAVVLTGWVVPAVVRMGHGAGVAVVAGSVVRGLALLALGWVVHYALGPEPLAYWLGLVCGWVGVKAGELTVVWRALGGAGAAGAGTVA